MDNKQIFAIAGDITRSLFNSKIVSGKAKDIKGSIFDAIQPILEQIDSTGTEESAESIKEEAFELARKLSNDKVYARGWLIQELARQVGNNNATASKELRDILQIASTEEDLAIIVESYEDTCVKCSICGGNPRQPAAIPDIPA